MSGRGKRIWAPQLDFHGALQETERFLKRAEEHNILRSQGPALFHAYFREHGATVDGMEEVSRYLRFGYETQPQLDRGRQAVVRLLAVAVKAHYFLAPTATVPHEPYVFNMPDLAMPGQLRYGLVYPLEIQGQPHVIQVAEWDLAMASSKRAPIAPAQHFPAVLPENPYRWLQLGHWKTLRQASENAEFFGSTVDFARRKFYTRMRDHTDLATFPYGTVLDYPRDMNPEVKSVGGMWAPGINKFFLPVGFDGDAVREYLQMQLKRSPSERYAYRWWDLARPPSKQDGGASASP